MDILTVHYNTPYMMERMIRSLNKRTVCRIHVFDNSDDDPFVNKFNNVDVIDNTKGQVINFDEWLTNYPERKPRGSNYGSPKHCKSVDICFDLFPNGFILMDSDVLVKKDITPFWDEDKAFVGETFLDTPKGVQVMRVLPFLCYVNVPMLKRHDVRYFNAEWMWHLLDKTPNKWYDTGAWFYKDCMAKGLPHGERKLGKYIEHFFHGSHMKRNENLPDWLREHRDLWI